MVLGVACAITSCRLPGANQASVQRRATADVCEQLRAFAGPARDLTAEELRDKTISGVFGGAWLMGTCGFVAVPTPDGAYDLRVERNDAGKYEVVTTRIERAYAEDIRRGLAEVRLAALPTFKEVLVLDAGILIVFIELSDGRLVAFGGTDAYHLEPQASTPLGRAMSIVFEAFIEGPRRGEDPAVKELRACLDGFIPRADGPYTCLYDVAPICAEEKEAEGLARRIGAHVLPEDWQAGLGISVEARGARLFIRLPDKGHSLVRAFLEKEGLKGAQLDPIPPERLIPPRRFIGTQVRKLIPRPGQPIPPELKIVRPLEVTCENASILHGAQLYASIEKQRRFDNATLKAIRARECPLLVVAALGRLLCAERKEGRQEETAKLEAVLWRWQESASWTSSVARLFTRRY